MGLLDAARVALARELVGWSVRSEGEELKLTAPELPDGLVLELTVGEDDGELDASFTLVHPVAELRLLKSHVMMTTTIDRELELEPDPEALARAAAAEAARLVAAAATIETFAATLADEPYFSGDPADLVAAARGDARFPDEQPGPDWRAQWRDTRARVTARREALAAMEARRLDDPAARAAALEAELAARGQTEEPLWIRLHAEPAPRPTGRGLLRDVIDLTRRFRAGELDPLPYVSGPWHDVALEPDAQPVLAAAFDASPNRAGPETTLAAEVRPGGVVVLGEAVVGHADGAEPGPAWLQLGRVGDAGHFAAQVKT